MNRIRDMKVEKVKASAKLKVEKENTFLRDATKNTRFHRTIDFHLLTSLFLD